MMAMKPNKAAAVLVLAAALIISGCRQAKEPQPESVISLSQVSAAPGDSLEIYATISQTKTSIADDGLKVNWEQGDGIGVLLKDASGDLSYYTFSLYSGQGTPDGVFKGRSFSGDILGVFYPCPQKLNVASNTSGEVYFVNFQFPAVQDQNPGSATKFSEYDFKAARLPISQDPGNYRIRADFEQVQTMLDVEIIFPSTDIGKTVNSLNLSTASNIAGDFYMNISNVSNGVQPGDEMTKTVSVTFNNRTGAVVPPDGKLSFRMFVLPGIRSGQTMSYSIEFDGKFYTFEVTAAKDFEGGFRYKTTLDLPALDKKGKLTVIEEDPLTEITVPGIYRLDNDNQAVITNDEYWQCSWAETSFNFVNWDDKQLVAIAHPAALATGSNIEIEISASGGISGIPTGKISVQVVYKDSKSGLCWMKDSNGLGYVICID